MESFDFEELGSCVIGGVPVVKLKSRRTGIVVYHARVEGPLVNGYFCLATEALDHDGLPHTLEHLIFLGSENYPYKGVLDQVANRCLASGTNAWTDVDHTAYTMMTAGSHGFLTLMPIYLEHILYPTLTDAGFITEVHHVNGDGDDAGVVYCEMQACENTAEERTEFQLLQHMYPGDCGYKSQTGGHLHNLRTTCSNEKVQAYHRQYYRPDNLGLIITGQLELREIFAAMAPIEDMVLKKGLLPPMKRPWQSPVPPLVSNVCEVVPYPCDDEEEEGLVRMAWRGPKAVDRYMYAAILSLLEYLHSTSVAPLQCGLIQLYDPYCSEIEVMLLENSETCVGLTFHGVPQKMLHQVKDRVLEILSDIVDGKTLFDLKRMQTILHKQIRTFLNKLEEQPHFFVAFQIIGDFLFGTTAADLVSYLDQTAHFQKLLSEPEGFWIQLLNNYFLFGPHVVTIGQPSITLAETMAAEEKDRVAKQRAMLGEAGLIQKSTELNDAIKQNELPPPEGIVNQFLVPSTESIKFHPLLVIGNHSLLVASNPFKFMPVDQLQFFFEIHHIHTPLVKLTAVLNTAVLRKEMKHYVPLYLELLFDSPVLRNGMLVPYDQKVKELAEQTVSTAAALGQKGKKFLFGTFPEMAFVTIKVEPEMYTAGIEHLKEVLFGLQFTKDKVSVVATKLLNYITKVKRMGDQAVIMASSSLVFNDESTYNAASAVTQQQFLDHVLTCLKDPITCDQVLQDLFLVQQALVSLKNLRMFTAMRVDTLTHTQPIDPWLQFVPSSLLECTSSPLDFIPVCTSVSYLNELVSGRTVMVGVGGVESSYLIQSVPCIKTHGHPDFPPMLVLMEYLGALEGPMWRQIRGMGLSYGYKLECKPEDGLLYFKLSRSSQLVQAYQAACSIMNGFLKGLVSFDLGELEAARSGVIFSLVDLEKSTNDLADHAILACLKNLDTSYSQILLNAVANVSVDDLIRVGHKYFANLFDPSVANCAVVCNISKVEQLKIGFESLGHNVSIMELDQLSCLNQLQH